MRRSLIVLVLISLTAAAPAASARSVAYRATISGQQELEWKVDGVTTGCESRRGAGKGRVAFRFREQRAIPTSANSFGKEMTFNVSIPSKATGSISGAFTDSVATACPGFAPREPLTSPVTGCGSTTFGLRVDVQLRGAYLYVTGPNTPLGPVSTSQTSGDCPFQLGGGITTTSDRSACGDGTQLWKRSWGVSSAQGQGLFASRIANSGRGLLRPKRRTTTLSKRVAVDCTVPSQYSGGVKITGVLRYTLTLRRG